MLQLNLHPSRYFLMLILLVHVVAVLLTLNLALQWWAMVLIEAFILGSFVHMVQKYILRKSMNSIVSVCFEEKNCILINRRAEKLVSVLQRDSSSTAFLVTLNFKLDNGKRETVLVFPDSIDKINFRRLRSRLKTWKF